MRINVEYDKYDTKMIKAEIPVSEDSLFGIELIKQKIEDAEQKKKRENDEEVAPEEELKEVVEKLALTGKDFIVDNEVQLLLNKEEVRELVVLLNKFRKSMK